MNTNNIKKYAPKARREFMDAVAKRLNTFGITANKKASYKLQKRNYKVLCFKSPVTVLTVNWLSLENA